MNLVSHDIIIDDQVNWDNDKNLVLHTKGNIIFRENGKIISGKNGLIILKSGMEPGNKVESSGSVIFEDKTPQIEIRGKGLVKIYYNPTKESEEHKFYNPKYYGAYIYPSNKENSYMLINDINDLQEISWFPSGNYALSQNINAIETKSWDEGRGFMPIGGKRQGGIPFTGDFEGNNYVIKNLHINRPKEDDVGIFAFSSGRALSRNAIGNLCIEQAHIIGKFRVGTLISEGFKTNLQNINIKNSLVTGYGPVGALGGTLENCFIKDVVQDEKTMVFISNKQIKEKIIAGAIICLLCPQSDNGNEE